MTPGSTNQAQSAEQHWVTFQLNVAALRSALGPLYNTAYQGRRGHTFMLGDQPPEKVVRVFIGPTKGQPNGVPDAFGATTEGSSSARVISVASATTILILLDKVIQEFARTLGQANGESMKAGDSIPAHHAGVAPVHASTLIWAGANNVRHVDEWASSASSFANPQTAREKEKKAQQLRSMQPLADVLGVQLPITDDFSYEVFQLLTAVDQDETRGTYDRLERHVFRIGQDLVSRSGLVGAQIGLTLTELRNRDDLSKEEQAGLVISDGPARMASSVHTPRIRNVNPPVDPSV